MFNEKQLIISKNGWISWYKEKHFVFRFIIIVILFRPLIDQLYFVKSVSIFFSPLYWIGIITPLICLYTILREPLQRGFLDRMMTLFSILLLSSSVFMLFTHIDKLSYWQMLLRVTMPFYLFFYFRRFIKQRKDLEYILVTFMFSLTFVLLMLFYETIFSSFRNETSRGLERIQANFGDVASYGIYLNLGLIVSGYFHFIKERVMNFYLDNSFYLIVFSIVISIFRLNHITSVIVFVSLFVVFVYYFSKKQFTSILIISILISILIIIIEPTLEVPELFSSEIEHLENEDQINQFGHGRLGRILNIAEIFENADLLNILFGLPYTLNDSYFFMYGSSGIHNDFLRIFSFAGLVGLIIYLSILFNSYIYSKRLGLALQYLIVSMLVFITLTSMTLTPTTYYTPMYLLLPLFSYISLNYKYE